ncbi:MAG TPA: DUF4342 domain-containing protein [Clostridiaceae bacterium]
MYEITLEKVDLIRERADVTYNEAKEALEASEGNVVDALIYLENKIKTDSENKYTTKDEFIAWLKGILEKGNVTRIVLKKDDKVIVNLPVTAGVAVSGLMIIILPSLLAIGILTALFVTLTVEITKTDGSVEVVNKIIKNTAMDIKDKFTDISKDVINKVNDLTKDVKDKFNNKSGKNQSTDNVYKYTVKFDEIDKDK